MASEARPKPINVRLLLHRIAMASSRGESDRAAEQDIIALDQETTALRARVAELEDALRPFARSGSLFGPRLPDDYDQRIYDPAAGAEYALCGDDLRRAARTLKPDEATP